MKISVIIPAYNCAQTLCNTIDSILKSGLEDYEIIVVDDGSSDGTAMLCDKLPSSFPMLRVYHQENSGVSSARNRGLREAQGEYVWFFDADDSVDPESMTRVQQAITREEPDMLLFGMSFDYYHKGKVYRRDEMSFMQNLTVSHNTLSQVIQKAYASNYLSPCWNKLIRRNILTSNGVFFQEGMILLEDLLFTLDALQVCEKVCFLEDVIYRYRQPEDEGNAARRLKKIPSLVDYMDRFASVPEKWSSILDAVYYMLLHQKVRASNAKEISEIAEDHKRSCFQPLTQQDHWLCEQLENGNYRGLYLRNMKSRVRHGVAVFAKSHGLCPANGVRK